MAPRSRRVRWSRAAAADLQAIVDHIATERPLTAEKILNALQRRTSALRLAADRGRQVPELLGHGVLNLREIIVSVWRVVYEVGPDTVDVLAVFDSRRNIEDVLLLRLTRRR